MTEIPMHEFDALTDSLAKLLAVARADRDALRNVIDAALARCTAAGIDDARLRWTLERPQRGELSPEQIRTRVRAGLDPR